jgi:SAM-dependent methyltransferase
MWLVSGSVDPDTFIDSGKYQFDTLLVPLLRRNNVEINNLHAVLDFGCGCGRLTRWFHTCTKPIIWGVDCNKRLVRWCQKNLRFAEFSINRLTPPLDFENETFDFILIRSVFTHLSEITMKEWLKEFHRIIAPNGIILFTVHGDYFLPDLDLEETNRYRDGNMVVKHDNFEGSNKCAIYHPPAYLLGLLPVYGFEIIDNVPGGNIKYATQDTYLARKIDWP